jgi:hypothetical protein
MPARSQAQRELLNARFGHDWVKRHHFDNKGKLPERAPKRKGKKSSRHELYKKFADRHG